MESESTQISPTLLSLFDNDKERVLDFCDSLNKREMRIMKENLDNVDTLSDLKKIIEEDLDDTAKQLEMEN